MLVTSQLNNASSVPVLSGGSVVPLVTVPPGPCTVVISNTTNVTVYLGTGATLTVGNGFPLPSGALPVSFTTEATSNGETLYVLPASTPGSGAVGALVSTSH